MKQILSLGFAFLFYFSAFSQSIISGVLKTEAGEPISGASLTITDIDTDNVVNYDISDIEGKFSISVRSDSKELQLNIRAMGYKTIVRIIDNKTQDIHVILQEEITILKEIVVDFSPIVRKGDTLSYSVDAFSKQEDRTIADVLKNMPGIEVLSDGKILYQGKPINKYYIEGLDLLGGKYNLANKNLPYVEVTKVQILENHQPIKVLDSLIYSDQAAINLKLKNSFTFTGQAEMGSGFSPLLWDANITPMLFSKQKQMVSSYQTNNIGHNVATQLKTLTIEDLLEQFERNDEKQDWLEIQALQTPDFSDRRWLDNNVHLITSHYLHKLKNSYELRINVSYLNDHQKQNGFTSTQFFTANDTIALFENKYNQLYTNTLETNLSLQKNTANNFLKNSLQFQGFWDNQLGSIELNNGNISQNLNNHYFKISNNLKTLFPLGKQIITLNSYLGFNKTPQSLTVNPGQFNDLLNNGVVYSEVSQEVELSTFYTNNSLGFTRAWRRFSYSPKFGFQFESQYLNSGILTSSDAEQPADFENKLDWIRYKIYFNLQIQYKKEKWRVEFNLPINSHYYNIEDKTLQKKQALNFLTLEPGLAINYDLSSYWRMGASANLSNHFGTISQLYYNYILQNYRNIQRIDSPLQKMQNINFSASIGYRNPIQSLFCSLIYTNTTTVNNLLYDTQILDNGASEFQATEQENESYTHNFTVRASKYFNSLNTNLTLSSHYGLQDFQQILNAEITNIANQNWRLEGKLDTDISDWLNIEIESAFQFSNSKIQEQNNKIIIQQFHKFNINIYPKDNQYLGLKTEHIKNNLFSENSENFFADMVYRYTLKKKNIDLELQWNNIFNAKSYRTVNVNNFSYLESNFSLRPTQFLFKIRFSL